MSMKNAEGMIAKDWKECLDYTRVHRRTECRPGDLKLSYRNKLQFISCTGVHRFV